MPNDIISVIVPIYNVESYLRKCVDSILAQTYTNLEIILIDDGSPDNCGAICDEYAKTDERIKVIHKPNGGVSSARNAGLDVAKGEYIAFVDADDYIPEPYLENLYKDMTDDVDMVRCEADKYLPNGGMNTKLRTLKSTVVLDSSDVQNFKYKHWSVWGVLYRRSVIGDLRFNVRYYIGEDTLFYYSAIKNCRKIKYTISTSYCYVNRTGSATHSCFGEKQYTVIYAWRDICRMYADDDGVEEVLRAGYVLRSHDILNKIRYYGINNALEKMKFLKREIRHNLLCGLRAQDCTKLRRAGFILDAFVPEFIYRHVMLLYYFAKNRPLYKQLRNSI